MIRSLAVRLKALLFRASVDAELDEELQYHLDREIERNVARGMTRAQARDAARRAFGNVTSMRELAREAWHWPRLETLRQDVAYAVRSFGRAPLFAITVIATIGLGLGLLSSAFTFFDAYVLRAMPVRDPHSLYELSWTSANGRKHRFTLRQLEEIRANSRVFSDAFAFQTVPAKVRGQSGLGQAVSANYFATLGVPAAIGRTLVPGDDDPGVSRTIVLSHHLWRGAFAGDSSVIGSSVDVDGQQTTIVGVARERFGGLTTAPFDFWIPIRPPVDQERESMYIVGRLAPGIDEDGAYAGFRSWMRASTTDRPPQERATNVSLIPRGTAFPKTPETVAIFGPVIIAFQLILLIACANVMNLMLARGVARQREIGIRLALGAGRARIVQQLLTEAVLLAAFAGVLGFIISRVAIATVLGVMYATVPDAYSGFLRVIPLHADWTVIAFLISSCLITAIVFGLAPALQSTRPNLVQASRGDFDTPFRPMRLRNGLVVAQISVSVLLLICAGVLLSAARDKRRVDPGMRVKNVLQLHLRERTQARVVELLQSRPEVRSLASSSSTPLDGGYNEVTVSPATAVTERVTYMVASPGYFDVLDLPVLAGRHFTNEEARSRAGVVIISETAARRLWPNQNPLGQLLVISPTDADYEYLARYHSSRVIGVTRDVIPGWIGRDRQSPTVYFPQPLVTNVSQLLVLLDGDAAVAASRIDRALTAGGSSPVVEMHTLDEALALQVYPFQALYWVASALGVLALALTVTGVYGLLSYGVSQRRREFGVRMALGATRPGVVALVLRESARLSLMGIAVGGSLALAASRLFAGAIVNVRTFDAFGYVAGTTVVFATCVLAAYAPSARAARVNPADAIRES